MTSPAVTLGYVILYVTNVEASLAFYEKAFGLSRRFLHSEGDKSYGELETGAARLAFASIPLAREHLKQLFIPASPEEPPLGVEVALVTNDVPTLYNQALAAGAKSVAPPETKPWGQTVAYLRDNAGHLIELCTPVS